MFRTTQSARLLARIQCLVDAAARSDQHSSVVADALRLAACSCLAQTTPQQPPLRPACSGAQWPASSLEKLSAAQGAAHISPSGQHAIRQLATRAYADDEFDDDGDNTEVTSWHHTLIFSLLDSQIACACKRKPRMFTIRAA